MFEIIQDAINLIGDLMGMALLALTIFRYLKYDKQPDLMTTIIILLLMQ